MEKLQVRMMIEILGKPKENVLNAMNGLVNKLGAEKGVTILEKTIHEPVEFKESKELFTTFTEIIAEFDSVSTYLLIAFAYLPSNLEIISPETVSLSNHELGFLGTKIIQRIHEYDAVVKKTLMDKDILVKKLQEVAPQLFIRNPLQITPTTQTSKQLVKPATVEKKNKSKKVKAVKKSK